MRRRPRHLVRRFADTWLNRDEAVLITETPGARNQYGEWEPGGEERTPMPCSTVPSSEGDVRILRESGADLDACRTFHTYVDVEAITRGSDRTVVEWGNRRWLVKCVLPWSGFNKVLCELEREMSDE